MASTPVLETFNQYFDSYYDVRNNDLDDIDGFNGTNRYFHTELTQMAKKLWAIAQDQPTVKRMGFQRYQRVSNTVHEMLAATATAAYGRYATKTRAARDALWAALLGLEAAFTASTKSGNDGVDIDYPASLRKLINTCFDHQRNDQNGPNGLSGYPNPFSSEELQELTELLKAAKNDARHLSYDQLYHVQELRNHLVLRTRGGFFAGSRSGWEVKAFNAAWRDFVQAFREVRASRKAQAFLQGPTTDNLLSVVGSRPGSGEKSLEHEGVSVPGPSRHT